MRYFPSHLNIETSDHCNRSCTYCPVQHERGAHAPRLLSWEIFTRLVDELADAPAGLKASLQWIDEPLSNPRFFEYAEYARSRAPHVSWLLQSNGDFVTAPHIERLRTLFDGVSFNLYTASAAHSWAKRDLPTPLRTKSENPRLRLAHPGQILSAHDDEGRGALHVNEKYRHRYWVDDYTEVQMSPDDVCSRPWEQAAIGYDGQVYVCCRDNLKAHPVGQLADMSLYEAYNSGAAQRIRALMQAGRRDRIRMCHRCPKAFDHRFVVVDDATEHALTRHARRPIEGLADRVRERPPQDHFAPERDASPDLPAMPPFSVEDSFDDGTAPVRFASAAMPDGDYDYLTARQVASALGHVALPGILPRRYEVVVGLDAATADVLVDTIRREVPNDAFIALYVCGSRVVTRTRLYHLDPDTFEQVDGLPMAGKSHLRAYGKDPSKSSDLDIKLLVDEAAITEDDAAALGERLGSLIEPLAPHMPISGHPRPVLRAWRVPAGTPEDAFFAYNVSRPARIGKCALSLQYVQLLSSVANPTPWTHDVRRPVRDLLQPRSDGIRMSLSSLPTAIDAKWMRAVHHGLTGHQWVGALLDFPKRDLPGIVVHQGAVVAGHAGVYAAREAGRADVSVDEAIDEASAS